MVNPFDDNTVTFLVLVNAEHEHSLWPARFAVPPGWHIAHAEDSRENCLAWIEANWQDLSPASLVRTGTTHAAEPER